MRPVILIPGIGGSILVRKGAEYKTVCNKKLIDNRWINLGMITNFNMYKRWKKDISESADCGNRNVEKTIVPFDFGGTKGVKNIFPEISSLGLNYIFHNNMYFDSICSLLYSHGYTDYNTLHGAPYDFINIMIPYELNNYFNDLTGLIESTVKRNGDQKSVVVTHSFGGILFKLFLDTKDYQWVNKYIDTFVCVSVPFGGTVSALISILYGSHYIPFLRKTTKEELAKLTSIITCIPNNINGIVPVIKKSNGDYVYNITNSYRQIEVLQPYIPLIEKYHNNIKRKLNKRFDINIKVFYNCDSPTIVQEDLYTHSYILEKGDKIVDQSSLEGYINIFPTDKTERYIIGKCEHTSLLNVPEFLEHIEKIIKTK